MRLLPRFVRRWAYRRRAEFSPDAFVAHLEDEFGRGLDSGSLAFFRDHPVSTGFLHEILVGRLRAEGTGRDERIMITLLNDMAFSTPDLDPEVLTSRTPLSDVLEAFAAVSPDAGSVIGQAAVRFLGIPRAAS